MERIDLSEEKEKEIEARLAELERTGKELKEKLKELEGQIGEFTGQKKKAARKYNPLGFIKAERDNEIPVPNNKTPAAGDEVRRDLLKKQITGLVQKYSRRSEEPLENGSKTVPDDERRKILKRQIADLMEKFEARKDSKPEGQIKGPIGDLKIKTDRDVWDARPLFELLIDVGSIKSDDAARRLGVDKNRVNAWSEDLEKSGLVEITRYPYGVFELRLADITVLLESKKKA